MWDSTMKRVTCLECLSASARPAAAAAVEATASHDGDAAPAADDVDVGRPGASAQREYERRRTNRIEKTHARHPHIGGLLLAVQSAPQHEIAFRSGAEGEREVADSLEARTASSPATFLHDRRMPRGRGNIDHLAIAASGVYVIDAKNHKVGKVRIEDPLLGKARLVIDGRDQTKLIDGLDRQVAAVTTRVAGAQIDVPVVGVLCFTKADLPLLGTMKMRSHLVLYRKALAKRLNAPGPLGEPQIRELAAMLARALPPA
ncbi:MAG: hypothetical protein JWM31_529 [Solirubrobacterales bacterium]|nr:hypothetical protein [Solirubrobacterales bacterium]